MASELGVVAWHLLPNSFLQWYEEGGDQQAIEFRGNFYKLKFQTHAANVATLALAGYAIKFLVVGNPTFALAAAVAAVALAVLWKKWGNQSWLLAKKAWDAIRDNPSEYEIVQSIDAGADIYRNASDMEDRDFKDEPPDFLSHAAGCGRGQVVQKLVDLGMQTVDKALIAARDRDVAEILIHAGASVNPVNNVRSLLYFHSEEVCICNLDKWDQPLEDFLLRKVSLMDYLIILGARFRADELGDRKPYLIGRLNEIKDMTNCSKDLKDAIDALIYRLQRV